jgi:hypothetical protein
MRAEWRLMKLVISGVAAAFLSAETALAQTPDLEGRRRQPIGAVTLPDSSPPAATATLFPWVGSLADSVYFRATCAAAQDLSPSNRRYFRSEDGARLAGYRRSRVGGC